MSTNPFKGKRNGLCNRTACQKPGATFYNISTRAWYCPKCAEAINLWSIHDDGVVICVSADHPLVPAEHVA